MILNLAWDTWYAETLEDLFSHHSDHCIKININGEDEVFDDKCTHIISQKGPEQLLLMTSTYASVLRKLMTEATCSFEMPPSTLARKL